MSLLNDDRRGHLLKSVQKSAFSLCSGSGKINVIDNASLCDNDRSMGNDDDDDHDLHDDGVSGFDVLCREFLLELNVLT